MMKRRLILPVAIILMILLPIILSGCDNAGDAPTGTNESAKPISANAERELIVFHIDEGYTPDNPLLGEMTDHFNANLAKRGIPAEIAVSTAPRVDFGTIPNERVDVMRINGVDPYRRYAAGGQLHDLTDELKSREALYHMNPTIAWLEYMQGDSIYAFPLLSSLEYNGIPETSLLIRHDILEELNVDPPATWDDLIELAELARDSGLDYRIVYPYQYPPYALHRTYNSWPFYVDTESTALYRTDGSLESYFHSEEYEADTITLNNALKGGLLKLLSDDEIEQFKKTGDQFLAAMFPIMNVPAYSDKISFVQLMPDKPSFSLVAPAETSIVVPATVDPARLPIIMDVIEAIYTDIDLYDSFVYGIKDETYFLTEENTIVREGWAFMSLYYHGGIARPVENSVKYLNIDPATAEFIDFVAPFFRPIQPAKLYTDVKYQIYKSNGLMDARVGLADSSTVENNRKMLEERGLDSLLSDYQAQYDEYLEAYRQMR